MKLFPKLLNHLVKLYKKTEFTQKVFLTARTLRNAGSSRQIEYGWVLRHLQGARRILDVGSTNSLLPIQLASMGYDVYSIDPRNYKKYHGLIHPKMKFIQGDMRFAPFTSGFFDIVTAVSTIEHIGTCDYKNPLLEENGDTNTVREIARCLKQEGKFIFTVPYRTKITISMKRKWAETLRRRGAIINSVKSQQSPLRAYNEETIRKRLLTDRFYVEKEKYFYKQGDFWYPASTNEIKKLDVEERLACIIAKKN